MPRHPIESSLPTLETLLPQYVGMEEAARKFRQIADILRGVISTHRSKRNLIFYSTRVIARFFGSSQHTASLAVAQLESEGLLRRVRGTHTLMLGTSIITRTQVQAVVGFPVWWFGTRYSKIHGYVQSDLGDSLWRHNMVVDTIPHWDLGENRLDLNDRLERHEIDFALWLFPFRHHRENLLRLQDRGIRNLVVGLDTGTSPFKPQVIADITQSYINILEHWRGTYNIRQIRVVDPTEFPPRGRIRFFVALAERMGFETELVASTPTLPRQLAELPGPIGIVLLDEHSTVEYVFYDPNAFVDSAMRHRILFGNNYLNIPFIPHNDLNVERIWIDSDKLTEGITATFVRWRNGDFTDRPYHLPTHCDFQWKLWRYL